MSGGFLGRALGLGRALLLRGFGGGTGAPPATNRIPCVTVSAPYSAIDVAVSGPVPPFDPAVSAPHCSLDLSVSAPRPC